jgi:c-di-GMP-related signal transduction protein
VVCHMNSNAWHISCAGTGPIFIKGMNMEQFIARQPIFDGNMKVFGYELLFRNGVENCFSGTDEDQATSQVIATSALLFGMESLLGNGKGFINFTRKALLLDYASVLPKKQIVVEILENVEPDADVMEACRRLKKNGYILALDDFVYDARFDDLLKMADIVKVDFFVSDIDERKRMVEAFKPRGIKMLVEKVETQEEFDQAMEMGYNYFQGYFFSKPVIVSKKDVPGFKINQLRILQMVNQEEMDFQGLSELIQNEMSITYKLLKVTNSAAFGLRNKVTSIKQALNMLGEKGIRKWASILLMTGLGEDKPQEQVVSSLVRAKFCELMTCVPGWQNRGPSLFLVGLFSRLDVIIGRPLPEILAELPLKEEISDGILQKGELSVTINLIEALEQGQWPEINRLAKKLGIEESILQDIYLKAVQWASLLEKTAGKPDS